MALKTNEVMLDGFVRDTSANYAIVVTTNQVGAKVHAGFLRDPDGRLVVLGV